MNIAMTTISWILTARDHGQYSSSGWNEKSGDTHIHTENAMSMRKNGPATGLRSLSAFSSMLANRHSAISIENGKSYAHPQLRRCGFIMPTHTHVRSPMNGRRRMNGISPKMIAEKKMSRMDAPQPGTAV